MARTEHPEQTRTPLVVACLAQLMVVLDVSVINVAIPRVQAALGFGATGVQWVSNAYLLAFGGLLLLGARLADVFGTRRVFLTGLAVFCAASLAGGLATGPGLLVAARAAQGMGAAVLAPATLTLVTTTYPEGQRRTRALASWTAVSVAGGTVGNLLGGALTGALSWRWTLLINVPVGVVAVVLAARALPTDRRRVSAGRLDVPGAVLVTSGCTALTYGITMIRAGQPLASTLAVLLSGALLVVGFVVVEARFARVPLLPLGVFRVRGVVAGNVVMLLAGGCFQAPMWYLLTVYMQNVLHYTPLQAGVGFLPHTLVTIVVVRLLTPPLMHRIPGRWLVVAGLLVAAAGFVWQSRVTPDSGYLCGILAPVVVFSVGGGLFNTPLTAAVTSGVEAHNAGAASGVMNTAKQVGGAVGLAALVGIATAAGTEKLDFAAAFLASAVLLVVAAVVAGLLPTQRDVANLQNSA